MPKVKQQAMTHQDKKGVLTQDAYEPGNFVSADQHVVDILRRLMSGYECEVPHD